MSLLNEENHTGGLIYDKAKYHFLGQFPSILPIEQAYVHIGMFFGWMLENDLYGEIFEDEEAAQVYRFKRREISAGLLSELWDGYLGEDLFNKEGNAFSKYYYQSRLYRKDYEEVLAKDLPTIYHVEDTWENYEKIAQRITERYNFWKANPDAPVPEIPEYVIKPEVLTANENLFERNLEEIFENETDNLEAENTQVLNKGVENSQTTSNEPIEQTLPMDILPSENEIDNSITASEGIEPQINQEYAPADTPTQPEDLKSIPNTENEEANTSSSQSDIDE